MKVRKTFIKGFCKRSSIRLWFLTFNRMQMRSIVSPEMNKSMRVTMMRIFSTTFYKLKPMIMNNNTRHKVRDLTMISNGRSFTTFRARGKSLTKIMRVCKIKLARHTRTMPNSNWNNLSNNKGSMCSNKKCDRNCNRSQADNSDITKRIKRHPGSSKKVKCKRIIKKKLPINSKWNWKGKDLKENRFKKINQLAGLINMTISTLGTSLKSYISTRLLTLCIKRRLIPIVINPFQGPIITQEFKKSLKFKLIKTSKITSEASMPTLFNLQ